MFAMQLRQLSCFCQCTQLFLSVLDWHQTCLLLCCCVCLLSVTRKCSLAGAASMTCSWHPRAIGCQAKALTHTHLHTRTQQASVCAMEIISSFYDSQSSAKRLQSALCTLHWGYSSTRGATGRGATGYSTGYSQRGTLLSAFFEWSGIKMKL